MVILLSIIKSKYISYKDVFTGVHFLFKKTIIKWFFKNSEQNISRTYFNSTLNAIHDAVIRTDNQGRILNCNLACLQLLNVEEHQLINHHYSCIKAGVVQGEVIESFTEVFNKGYVPAKCC